jgi:hypothetical protein
MRGRRRERAFITYRIDATRDLYAVESVEAPPALDAS